jgi:hypothetical protein
MIARLQGTPAAACYLQLPVMLLLSGSLGCNRAPQSTYPAKGIVKWSDGQPAKELADGTIELQVIEGPKIRVSPRGLVQSDGTFALRTYRPDDGAPAGKYRVAILPCSPAEENLPPPPQIIDRRLQSFQTTPLQIAIKPAPNEIELTIERP